MKLDRGVRPIIRISIIIFILMSCRFSIYAEPSDAEPHEAVTHVIVQAALTWELPKNQCIKPRLKGAVSDGSIGGTGDVVVGGSTGQNSNARYRYDVDHYQLGRYQRATKRWEKCTDNYRENLLAEFNKLKNTAQHGLTQSQANIILGKMALIQSTLESNADDP